MIRDEREEQIYVNGERSAFRQVLSVCLRELDPPEKEVAGLVSERESAIAYLRSLCDDFGDNEWSDNLHLADIIEKHLGRFLYDSFDSIKGDKSKFV